MPQDERDARIRELEYRLRILGTRGECASCGVGSRYSSKGNTIHRPNCEIVRLLPDINIDEHGNVVKSCDWCKHLWFHPRS